jgi:hypothetical protein
MLPFTHDRFLALFAEYNTAIWPAQVLAYAVGIAVCVLVRVQDARRGAWIGAALALLWIWTGAVYHIAFFSRINGMALAFGTLFVLQGLLLAFAGITHRLEFTADAPRTGWRTVLGWTLVVYAALAYPAIGAAQGMTYPAAPVFGVTPCPLTLFTWGILLMARSVPRWLLVIPFAWALVGGSAAVLLQVPQDWLLLASAGVAFLVPFRRTPVAR